MRPHASLPQRPETNIAVVTHSAFLWFTLTCFGNEVRQGAARACVPAGRWACPAVCLPSRANDCVRRLQRAWVVPSQHFLPASCPLQFAKPVRENLQRWYEVGGAVGTPDCLLVVAVRLVVLPATALAGPPALPPSHTPAALTRPGPARLALPSAQNCEMRTLVLSDGGGMGVPDKTWFRGGEAYAEPQKGLLPNVKEKGKGSLLSAMRTAWQGGVKSSNS